MNKTARRVVYGGAALAMVSLGLLLSQLGLPFGAGLGPGADVSLNDGQATTNVPTTPSIITPTPPVETDQHDQPDTTELITIIVVGKGYHWGTNDPIPTSAGPLTLDQIREKAKTTKGNPQGLRARVFRAGSALPSAENELVQALEAEGLPSASVLFEQRIIDMAQP